MPTDALDREVVQQEERSRYVIRQYAAVALSYCYYIISLLLCTYHFKFCCSLTLSIHVPFSIQPQNLSRSFVRDIPWLVFLQMNSLRIRTMKRIMSGTKSCVSGHRLFRKKRRSEREYCDHCTWHNWYVQLCPHYFTLASQSPGLFIPILSCITCVLMSRQRMREKRKTSVILPHAVHTHAAVLVAADALPFIASQLNLHLAGGRASVLCRVA